MRDIFDEENYFQNTIDELLYYISDEFHCLKKYSFCKEVNIFKNELLQPITEIIPDHYLERLISHLEGQIVVLRDGLQKQLSKCDDTIKISQTILKSNTKSFEKIISKEDQIEKTAKTDYKNNEKLIISTETTDKLKRTTIWQSKKG